MTDLAEDSVRWGPLLAYSYMQGCEFSIAPGLNYLQPNIDVPLYMRLGEDALEGMRMWLPRLGLQRVARPGPYGARAWRSWRCGTHGQRGLPKLSCAGFAVSWTL